MKREGGKKREERKGETEGEERCGSGIGMNEVTRVAPSD